MTSKTAVMIFLALVFQFVLLKSGDRTRVYRLEIDKLRRLRRTDETLLKRAKELLVISADAPPTEAEGRPGDLRQRTMDLARDIEDRL